MTYSIFHFYALQYLIRAKVTLINDSELALSELGWRGVFNTK